MGRRISESQVENVNIPILYGNILISHSPKKQYNYTAKNKTMETKEKKDDRTRKNGKGISLE